MLLREGVRVVTCVSNFCLWNLGDGPCYGYVSGCGGAYVCPEIGNGTFASHESLTLTAFVVCPEIVTFFDL